MITVEHIMARCQNSLDRIFSTQNEHVWNIASNIQGKNTGWLGVFIGRIVGNLWFNNTKWEGQHKYNGDHNYTIYNLLA